MRLLHTTRPDRTKPDSTCSSPPPLPPPLGTAQVRCPGCSVQKGICKGGFEGRRRCRCSTQGRTELV